MTKPWLSRRFLKPARAICAMTSWLTRSPRKRAMWPRSRSARASFCDFTTMVVYYKRNNDCGGQKMLMEQLFSSGVMQMGASHVDPERQVGMFNPAALAGLPELRAE